MELYDQLSQQEKAFHDALIDIAEKYGPYDQASSSIWVGYVAAEDNEDKSIGVKCSNCSFHGEMQGEKLSCALLSYAVEPEAICRLAAIPDGLVTPDEDMDKFWRGSFLK